MTSRSTPFGPRVRSNLIGRVLILTGLVAVADFVFGATFVTFMQDRGLSASIIGGLLSLTAVTAVLFEAPSGAWGDRYGHKRLVTAGLALWGIGFGTFAFSTTPLSFGIAILFWAAGLALYSGAATALMVNSLNSMGLSDRTAGAIRGTETVRWAAAALGACVVALSAIVVDAPTMILTAGAVLLVGSIWVARCWPESPRLDAPSMLRSLAAGVTFVFHPTQRMLLVLSVIASIDLSIVILTWQPAALSLPIIQPGMLGGVLLVLSLASAAGAALSKLLRRLPPRVGVAGILICLNASLLASFLGPWGLIAAFIGAELFIGMGLTALTVWGHSVFPDALRATGSSVLGTVTGLTIAGTNAVVGPLWDRLGLVPTIGWSGAVLAVLSFALLVVGVSGGRRVR